MKSMTREEANERQRLQRQASGNAYTKRYEKTVNGFLMRAHRNMRSRAFGIQAKKAHLYSHIVDVVGRSEFYEWAKSDSSFAQLWSQWVASGHDRKLTPSVDRVDSNGDYVLNNMQWITHSENSRRGGFSTRNKK
jgi:hypothetical protein